MLQTISMKNKVAEKIPSSQELKKLKPIPKIKKPVEYLIRDLARKYRCHPDYARKQQV